LAFSEGQTPPCTEHLFGNLVLTKKSVRYLSFRPFCTKKSVC